MELIFLNINKINKGSLFIKRVSFIVFFIFISFNSYSQCGKGGNQSPTYGKPDPNNTNPNSGSILSWLVNVFRPVDPNDIRGPVGYGNERWISINDPINYTIRFENDPKLATASANVVRITYPIDSKQNIFSFRLGSFGFNGLQFQVPQNASFYSQRLDLIATQGIFVDVTAGIDVVQNQAFWIFETIDPATGLPPTDPFMGFLPVKDSTDQTVDSLGIPGDGFVNFLIRPVQNAQTNDTTLAEASIVFDINEAIATNREVHTIDAYAPQSTIASLPLISNSTLLSLMVNRNDDPGGCGVKDFDLYVAADTGNYIRYLSGLTDSVIQFNGASGVHYKFYTLAQDNVGNREAIKTQPDAETTISDSLLNLSPQFAFNGVNIDSYNKEVCSNSSTTLCFTVSDNEQDLITSSISQFPLVGTATLSIQNDSLCINYSNGESAASETVVIQSCDSAGNCNMLSITFETSNVIPIFDAFLPICAGEEAPILPTTSTNGITGTWSPSIVSNNQSGTYNFTPDAGQCANPVSASITVNPLPSIEIVSPPVCSTDLSSYSFSAIVDSGVLSSNLGSVSNTIGNSWTISNVPIETAVTLTVEGATCTNLLVVNAPNCNCPTVAAPVSGGNQTYCAGGSIAAISASVNAGFTIDWYDLPSGGTILANGILTFNPINPGTYYAQARNASSGCTSNIRTAVSVSPIQPLTPTFTQVAPICAGESLSALPTTSNNGITGNWAPSLNNSATTTYTFSPTAGQCVTSVTMTIMVNPMATPAFTQVASICAGESLSALPTISNNGITGTWAPALNNSATTAYTFTPSAGQCANTTTMTVIVNPPVTPTFTQVAPLCAGGSLSALPTTSNNGITGTWSPALNNANTTTYTFTPIAGQCATSASMTITINPNVTPTFTQYATICSGESISALPTTSNNGITGTWSPEMNNTVTTTYTFTPISGQCASTATMTINVDPLPTISIINQPRCSFDFSTWSMSVLLSAGSLSSSTGNVENVSSNEWSISGIPSGVAITLTANSSCSNLLSVSAPDCSCPTVLAPVSGGDQSYCAGGSIASISATVAAGFTIDWYDLASGGTILANGTSTFNPTNPGAYYAQARNISSGCTSNTRTAVSVSQVQPVTPTFTQIAPICNGGSLLALPTISNNSITGTWGPALNNAITTNYTFTPSIGECATTATITIDVLPSVLFGDLVGDNEVFVLGGDPGVINFQTLPSGGSGSFSYQWYSRIGIHTAPVGNSTIDWTLIDGAISDSYNPPFVSNSISYAVQVDPTGTPECGNATWASGVRQIAVTTTNFIAGQLESGDQVICNDGNAQPINFLIPPSIGATYQWYYQDGIVAAPLNQATIDGWSLISDETSASLINLNGLTQTRTYACRVSNGNESQWASGVRQITVLPPFNPGSILNADQTFCGSGNPASITLSESPSGSGAYQWRWYFRENANGLCPTGNSIPSGWNTNNTSNNIAGTSFSGQGITFDPSTAGNVNSGRAFAVLITPISNGSLPACGVPQWANSCRKTFVIPCSAYEPGVILSSNETICNAGDPNIVTFSTTPSEGSTFQWYYKSGIVPAPNPTDPITGWLPIINENGISYNPSIGLTESRTYACRSTLSTISRWATGVRQVTVLPAFNPGVVTNSDQTFCNSGNPTNITLSQNPVGSGAYQWKWYYKESVTGDCPSGGTIPSGWLTNNSSSISGTSFTGSGISYDPQSAGTVDNGRTFAVLITPIANGNIPACGTAQWASSCRKTNVISCLSFTPGSIAAGEETVCNLGDPSPIVFSLTPSNGSTYRWYYKNGIVDAPSANDPISGWTQISGATSSSYNPPSGLVNSRTYACRVASGADVQWSTGVKRVTVLPAFNPGTLTSEDQTFCNSGNPSVISLSQNPVGSGAYQYRWYFRETVNGECPSGSSIPAGWNTNNTSVNISGISTTGSGLNFDPSSAGTLNNGRTFALLITPVANGNIPACGVPQWSSGCRKTFVIPCSGFNAGSLADGNQTICNGGDPSNIYLSLVPQSGSTRKWYFKEGIQSAPDPGDPTTGWTLINGATGLSYDPPSGLTSSRTYACRITNGTTNQWSNGVRQITVLPPFTVGTVTSGDQFFCNSGNPANITLDSNPTGSGGYQWRWYYKESSGISCPIGTETTTGWLTNSSSPNIFGTTYTGEGISFNPINAGANGNGRTFAVFITPISNGSIPACGTAQWANNCRKTFVNPCRVDQPDQEDTINVRDLNDDVTFEVYPIPNDGRFTARIESEETLGLCSIEVYDFSGRLIANQALSHKTGEGIIQFNLSDAVNGLYLLKFSNKNGLQIYKKILVIRQ